MMVGCVPVIIADEIEFPFEDELDWRALTVKIPEACAHAEGSLPRSLALARSLARDSMANTAQALTGVSGPDGGGPLWRLLCPFAQANATGVMSVLRAIPDDVIQAKRDAISKARAPPAARAQRTRSADRLLAVVLLFGSHRCMRAARCGSGPPRRCGGW